jgi:hypothetical protein
MRHRLGGFEFIPLIVGSLPAVCELDILFLRREQPGSLILKPRDDYGGDLDNRIKILFDALRVPCKLEELPVGAAPAAEEAPFYCLLEDDSLITKFQVESDTLLGGLEESAEWADVQLVLNVTMRITRYTKFSSRFSV